MWEIRQTTIKLNDTWVYGYIKYAYDLDYLYLNSWYFKKTIRDYSEGHFFVIVYRVADVVY